MNLKTFKKGVHPSYNKELSSGAAVVTAKLPERVVIPLSQHIGAPAEAIVKKGDLVEEGQKIGEANSFVSAPVHASISGKVKEVAMHPHASGGKVLSVVIEGDGETKSWPSSDIIGLDLSTFDTEVIRLLIRSAGIVGMGGAAFPTSVKLSPPKDKAIDSVILNGCECEPYLTADERVMVEEAGKVVWGLKAIMKSVGAAKGYIGVEDNKPTAIEALSKVLDGDSSLKKDIEIVLLETKYPQGAEKMLIDAVLGRVVPLGRLPLDVGVVVNNVGTAAVVYDAIKDEKPLIERIVTISGNGITTPKNLLVRVGTSFADVIEECGGLKGSGEKEVLNGGPMMGIAQRSLDVPVTKGTSGITVLDADTVKPLDFKACIKCASCVEVCPMNLMPYRLGDQGRLAMTEDFKAWSGVSCIECGCCSFVCPSKRPLVQWIRLGKINLRELERAQSS